MVKTKKVLALTQQPYWSETSDDDEDQDLEYPDTRIFQGTGNLQYLLASQEVKAKNGFVWCAIDKIRQKNIEKCSYIRPIPTRGNCVQCGRSGPLGMTCSNQCVYDKMSVDALLEQMHTRSVHYQNDPDINLKRGDRCRYRIMMTPQNEHMIDARMFAELMYKGVNTDQPNYTHFIRQKQDFQRKKHDRVLSKLTRWEDPWAFVFLLAVDCNWWEQLDFLTKTLNIDLEAPKKGMKYRVE